MTTIEDRHAAAGHEPVDIPSQEPQSEAISPHRARWAMPEAPEEARVALEVPDCGPTMAATLAATVEAHRGQASETRLTMTAKFWSVYLDVEVVPGEVAAMLGLWEIAR